MRKSKHFRKDVIIARIIAALILVALIALIVTVVSHFTKPSADKESQNTQNTQDINFGNQDSEDEDSQNQNSENQNSEADSETNSETESESESESIINKKLYVETTARIRLRQEPNTNCTTLSGIDRGVKLEVLESFAGWYKVTYDGKTGYVSADYVKIVEE